MIKVKNVRPGLLLVADAGLRLAPGETASVEKLTGQMERCLEDGLLTRIEPEPEAKPRPKSTGKSADPKTDPAAGTREPTKVGEKEGDSAPAGEPKAPDLTLKSAAGANSGT